MVLGKGRKPLSVFGCVEVARGSAGAPPHIIGFAAAARISAATPIASA
jgi:hypothetical protein